jgi:putative cell wall-binding protein
MLGAPLLLSTATTVPDETLSAMRTLGVTKVVFLGGTTVLSSALASQIVSAVGPVDVTRYSGNSRYETSAAIVAAYFSSATTTTAYVTVGDNFPDALAGTSAAVANGAPILLSQKSCMPPATYLALKNLGVSKVVLLGGTGVIDSFAASTQCAG